MELVGRRALSVWLAVVIVLSSASWWLVRSAAHSKLDEAWRAPHFALADQRGLTVSSRSLRGHPWIASFLFTSCTTVCPRLTAKLRALQQTLTSPTLRFVSFSVDPTHDTVEALHDYAERWGHDARWHLLRTDAQLVHALADGLRVFVRPDSNDILHTSLFFLVDSAGEVRGLYDSNDAQALARLQRDAQALTAPP